MSKSFASEDLDAVSCASSWQSNRSCNEAAAQTADVTFAEKQVQSKSSSSTEVQTDATKDHTNVDMPRLAAWLSRIAPRVIEEIEKSQKSHVFDEYKLQENVDSYIKHLCTFHLDENHPQFNFMTSAVDWSSTGGMLAVSRCAKEHPSWCEHAGFVHLHQTNRQESSSNTHRVLDVNACVTALSAHPSDSFILACGTFSGEVIVWNLQKDDPTIIGNVTLHSEAVVHMEWIQNLDVVHMRPVLVSASRDGSVIIWTMTSTSGTLKAAQCFLLQAQKENVDYGIVCAKFNSSEPNVYVAGIEGGSIALCTLDSRRPCLRKRVLLGQEIEFFDPVLNIFDGHKGTVTGMQWIPGSKDLFLSCGSDSEMHVYSLTEANLIRIIHLPEPSSGLEISQSHPNIAVTWGASGSVHLHDVHTTKMLPALELTDGSPKAPLCVVRIRTTSSQLLALGNIYGNLSVWQIPHKKFNSFNEF